MPCISPVRHWQQAAGADTFLVPELHEYVQIECSLLKLHEYVRILFIFGVKIPVAILRLRGRVMDPLDSLSPFLL